MGNWLVTGTKKPQRRGLIANSLTCGVSAANIVLSHTRIKYITNYLTRVKIDIAGLFRAINKNSRLVKLPPPTADSISGCERINNVIIPALSPGLTSFFATNDINRLNKRW